MKKSKQEKEKARVQRSGHMSRILTITKVPTLKNNEHIQVIYSVLYTHTKIIVQTVHQLNINSVIIKGNFRWIFPSMCRVIIEKDM